MYEFYNLRILVRFWENIFKWLVIKVIVREEDMKKVCRSEMRGGKGEVSLGFSLDGETQIEGSSFNMVATVNLDPGSSIGYHIHENDEEMYQILSGYGLYSDNGRDVEIKRGDVMVCPRGEGHSIANTGKDPLIFIAVIAG